MTHWKIGFHYGGGGGNQTGIKDDNWIPLAQAGRLVAYKSADEYGPVHEVAGIVRDAGCPNVIVYRQTGAGYDVPEYGLPPSQAAVNHWLRHKDRLPPEFDKDVVWLELTNEVDKNRAEWLGEFCIEIGALANAEGYKVVLLGFAPGEPESTHWRGQKMTQFLEWAGQRKGSIMVSVHEYSFTTDHLVDPDDELYMVGRVYDMLWYCVDSGIEPPDVVISELGWTHNDAPPLDQGKWHTTRTNELYDCCDGHESIQAALLWYLGGGYDGIADKVNPYIADCARQALQLPPPEEPDPPQPQYFKLFHLLSQRSTKPFLLDVIDEGMVWERRNTLGYSLDDAVNHMTKADVRPDSELHMWDWQGWSGAELQRVRDASENETKFRIVWHDQAAGWPLQPNSLLCPLSEPYWISSVFNDPRDYDGDGVYDDLHEGLDFAAPLGTPVLAVADGVVVWSGDDGGKYGTWVKLRHGGGDSVIWYSYYAHLSDALVSMGMAVTRGQAVGRVGATGNADGYHLHLSVASPGNGLEGYVIDGVVDPLPLVDCVAGAPYHDVGEYIIGDGVVYRVHLEIDGQEHHHQYEFQRTDDDGGFQVKNVEWERLWQGANHVWRAVDTSPGGDRYFTLTEDGSTLGSRWVPRLMRVGDRWTNSNYVQFWRKRDCAPLEENSGWAAVTIKLAAHHDAYRFWTGFEVTDVIELHWLGGDGVVLERYWYARGFGLVAWAGGAGRSAIESIGGDFPEMEVIPCLEV